MTRLKKYFLSLLLLELLLSYAPAYAQTAAPPYDYSGAGVSKQIEQYLCAPSPVDQSQTNLLNGVLQSGSNFRQQAAFGNNNSGDLYKCINQLYKFAIILAIVIGVFFLVIAGYIWMSAEGNEESVTKAKDILRSTIVSLVILFAGYLLLKTINPDLIQFHSIQPPSVVMSTSTPPTGTGCTGCVDLFASGIPTKNNAHIFGIPTLLTKLQTIQVTLSGSGISWYVTAAADPGHLDPCHTDGSCADLGVSPASDSSWSALCSAAKTAGFSTILNEASAGASQCPTYQTYSSTTGANIHVK